MSWHKDSAGHRKAALKRKRKMFLGTMSPKQLKKFDRVLHEFKEKKLFTGRNKDTRVTSKKQALAIAYSKARSVR